MYIHIYIYYVCNAMQCNVCTYIYIIHIQYKSIGFQLSQFFRPPNNPLRSRALTELLVGSELHGLLLFLLPSLEDTSG